MNLQQKSVIIWIAAILLFAATKPYFLWQLDAYFNYLIYLPLYIILFCYLDVKDVKFAIPFGLLTILANVNYQQNFIGIIFGLGLMAVFLTKKSLMNSIYEKFRLIYVIIISLSLFVFLLLFFNVSLPLQIIAPLNQLKTYSYYAYPFLVVPVNASVRFCGVFDEPGVVGTLSFLLLVIERANLKRKGNVIILLSGILSLSLFLYLSIGVYVLLKLVGQSSGLKEKLLLSFFIGVSVLVVTSNETTQDLIVSRMEWNSDAGTLTGDDRAKGGLREYVESIRGTEAYYWGVKNDYIIKSYSGAASIQNGIIKYGIIVVILFFVFYASYSVSYLKIGLKWLIFMIVLFMLLYNRPAFFEINRLFLYNMVLYSIYKNRVLPERKNNYMNNMLDRRTLRT